MDYLLHVANVLYLFSYLLKDILWLRVLTVIAATCLIPFFYFRPEPLLIAIYWNIVFTGINLYQIWVLLLERRPVSLSQKEQVLYQAAFRSLTPREFLKLINIASWKTAESGEQLVNEGEVSDKVLVIYEGKVSIVANNESIAFIGDGYFVGEMSFLTGEPTAAGAVADEPTEYVCWSVSELQTFLSKHPELLSAFQRVISQDLVHKLRARK